MTQSSRGRHPLPDADSILWSPEPHHRDRANLKRFMEFYGASDLDDLMARSTRDVGAFTEAVLQFLGLRFSTPYDGVVDLGRGPALPRWCPGGRMNITVNCLDRWLESPASARRTAVVAESEAGEVTTLTYAQLAAEVGRCGNALRALGIGAGDRVGLLLPMTAEIVVALLAVIRIGGVVLPLFTGFGAGAVASRLSDAGAAALITADGFSRRGATVPLKSVADAALAQVPEIRTVLVLRHSGTPADMCAGRDHWWHRLVPDQSPECVPHDTEAEERMMILYTSGTTGRPKGAVHTHCGFPVKAAQDMCFGLDVHPGDLAYWITDMGWMMGPWLVFGTSLLGASCFLYEGAPDYPDLGRIWAMAEGRGLTQMGLSPTLVRVLKSRGSQHHRRRDLSRLRSFASTGEPWNPEPWRWLFEEVGGGRIPIVNYSGGTEVSGGILMNNPLRPAKPAAFSAPCPGMDAVVLDEEGRPVRNQVGELAVRTPWIGMTRGFWRDEDNRRYLETYWSRFPGVWVHGDWALVDDDGHWWILGRSDDTINLGGKRVGPSEFESILVAHPAVVEAGAVGVPDELKGAEIVCFCVLEEGFSAGEDLEAALGERIVEEMGKPLRPGRVLFVPDLPKTRNAKLMRRVLRAAWLGEDPGDTSGLVNPEAVDAVRAIAARG